MTRRAPVLALRYLLAVPLAAAFLFPFYWMLVLSLNRPDAILQFPPRLWPQWQVQNYVEVWRFVDWPGLFANTVITTAGRVVLVLATSTLAGYAFASMRFAGKAAAFGLVLAVYMVPTEVTLVPNYITLSHLGWLDTYQAQIIPFGVSIAGIFLLRQFFLSLPPSLYEAAQLDGCSRFGFLWRIAMPLARPALAVIALQVFIGSWNAFLWPFLVTTTDSIRPVEVGLQYFSSADGTDSTGLAAAAAFTTLPVLVVFLLAQRQFIEGISAGGATG